MRLGVPLCVVLVVVPLTAAPALDRRPDSRLRCADDAAAGLVESATSQSATVRRLVEDVERSDLIVLVRSTMSIGRSSGATRFLASAPPGADDASAPRYLLIEFNPLAAPWDLVALLAHELQHAVEIAREPSVRSNAGLAGFYNRIGWSGKPGQYETAAAVETARRVRRELQDTGRRPGGALLAKR